MLRRFSCCSSSLRLQFARSCSAAAATSSSSPKATTTETSSTATNTTIRTKKWVELNPMEKWTTILDTAASVNTLLDDDVWDPPQHGSDTKSKNKSKMMKFRRPSTGRVVQKPDGTEEPEHPLANCGAPHVDYDKRISLRAELRDLLHASQLTRSDLAATFVGWGFWMRTLMDTQETLARHHLPFAQTRREFHALCATPLAGKFCRGVVDWGTSGTVAMGDDAAQQLTPEDLQPGLDLIDAANDNAPNPVLSVIGNDSSSSASSETDLLRLQRQLIELPQLRRLLETTMAHVLTSLYIDGHAVRLRCANRLLYVLLSIVFQHLVERCHCLEICFVGGDKNDGNNNGNSGTRLITGQTKTLFDPRLEMSSWVLTFTAESYRVAAFDKNPQPQQEQLLDRLASYIAIRQPHVIYVDSAAGHIAEALSSRVNKLLCGALSNKSPPLFMPIASISESWMEHAKTPYVSLFGPPSWEKSRVFRKQQIEDIVPRIGVQTARQQREQQAQLAASSAAFASAPELLASSSRAATAAALGDGSSNNTPPPQRTTRRRKPVPGLVVSSSSNNSSSSGLVSTANQQNNNGQRQQRLLDGSLMRAAVGINVDAKIMLRAYPELRSPCGAGNAFRYKTVARSFLRRKFFDNISLNGGPIGDPFLSHSAAASATTAMTVQHPPLLQQERVLEYFTGRAKPFMAVPVVAAKFGF